MEEVLVNLSGDTLEDYFNKNLVSIEELLNAMDDLIYDKEELENKIKDMEQDIKDNYKHVSIAEQCEISDRDFI